jgi:hypothetical protein
MNLVVHLRRPVKLVYGPGRQHGFPPEAHELCLGKLEGLDDMPPGDNAHVAGERGINRCRDPGRWEFGHDVERLAIRANWTGGLRTTQLAQRTARFPYEPSSSGDIPELWRSGRSCSPAAASVTAAAGSGRWR